MIFWNWLEFEFYARVIYFMGKQKNANFFNVNISHESLICFSKAFIKLYISLLKIGNQGCMTLNMVSIPICLNIFTRRSIYFIF